MKKLLSVALALSMIFSLTACSKQAEEGSSDSSLDDEVTGRYSTLNDLETMVEMEKLDNERKETISGMSIDSKTKETILEISSENAEAKGVCGVDLVWYYKDNCLVIRGTGEMMDFVYDYMEDNGGYSWTSVNKPWNEYVDS